MEPWLRKLALVALGVVVVIGGLRGLIAFAMSDAVAESGLLDTPNRSSVPVTAPPPRPKLIGIARNDLVFAVGSLPGLRFETSNASNNVASGVESITLTEVAGACVLELVAVRGDLVQVGFRMPEGLSETDPAFAKSIGCLMTVADVTKVPDWSVNLARMDPDFTVEGGGRRYRFLRGPGGRGFIVSSSQP